MMRQFLFLSVTTFLFSCSSKKSPEKIVEEFHQQLIIGETEKIREQCTPAGKDELDEYSEAFQYFGKNEKKEVASVKCSDGEEKKTCWCEEVKGYVVQYEIEKSEGKWIIDYKNFRPEIHAVIFHQLLNEEEYEKAKDYSTENGKTNISLLQGMKAFPDKKQLVSVRCEEENKMTNCYCENSDGSQTKYPMVKENGEWKVDYIKTALPELDETLSLSDSLEMMSSDVEEVEEVEIDMTEE